MQILYNLLNDKEISDTRKPFSRLVADLKASRI